MGTGGVWEAASTGRKTLSKRRVGGKKGLDKLCRHVRRPPFESYLYTVIPDNFPRFSPLSLTSRLVTAHEERSVASSG